MLKNRIQLLELSQSVKEKELDEFSDLNLFESNKLTYQGESSKQKDKEDIQ